MTSTYLILFLSLLVVGTKSLSLDFPKGFSFGAATSAYQVEGGWNASDKGVGTWDVFTHQKARIAKGHTGDVACDSYHQWRRDVEITQELGLDFYRFSISWSRLLPTGLPDHISEDGIRYYSQLIDGLLDAGVQPMVTITHMDLPHRIENMGGWTNPNIVDWFADYARVVYTLFGDRVKTWITINEPVIWCSLAYGTGTLSPGVQDIELAMYYCYKNQLLAHARAWRIYDEEFRKEFHGKVSIAHQLIWYEPSWEEDVEIAELSNQYVNDICSHPIFSEEGGWPPKVEALIYEKSKREGLTRSRLPEFTDEEIDYVRGTYDFYALNYYTARKVRSANPGEMIQGFPMNGASEIGAVFEADPSWKSGGTSWMSVHPEGLRKLLRWIKKHCSDPEVIITENGLPTIHEGRYDPDRVSFYRDHLKQVLLAIQEDKVNVTGFTVWSMIDSFEWGYGYTVEFGLYSVDFDSPSRERTPKKSAEYFASVIAAKSLDVATQIELATNSANRL